ncbi:hypothetical protein [Candidatus Spongiihabitans sp.]|uniref:hypothetical protein n=1 Tax=Candidatus Spongiihabitans sp. TaxID=3101308 RepID=UPI003C7D0961
MVKHLLLSGYRNISLKIGKKTKTNGRTVTKQMRETRAKAIAKILGQQKNGIRMAEVYP